MILETKWLGHKNSLVGSPINMYETDHVCVKIYPRQIIGSRIVLSIEGNRGKKQLVTMILLYSIIWYGIPKVSQTNLIL